MRLGFTNINKVEIWLINLKKINSKSKLKKKKRDLVKNQSTHNQTPFINLADECGKKCQINLSYPKHFLKNLEIKNFYNNESEQENFLVEFVQQSFTSITPIVQYFSEENKTTFVRPLSTLLNCIYTAKVVIGKDKNNNITSIVNLCDQNGGMVKKF